ncbi:oxidative damage protection protein [Gilvimarinus xylanilyticus]|uniref:Probable Fe(2+)-trafficking protein n=1 Tax=Gilvimarinus xylanilyticus TaxID=2944139 RepID=A0A9X2KU97_9GAMM|nr:oxidative damage protection protein [Gilvimarinus xylanilyticus]MCP8900686.1 oxidative damage protection protein [Gilvimarinus xylanilyticus]
MSRTVFCRKHKQELPGMAQPPFPGPKGQHIYENVSQQAWQEWLAHQTMLINEKQLNLMDTSTRVYLGEQMNNFLSGEDYDAAEGYIPPENNK